MLYSGALTGSRRRKDSGKRSLQIGQMLGSEVMERVEGSSRPSSTWRIGEFVAVESVDPSESVMYFNDFVLRFSEEEGGGLVSLGKVEDGGGLLLRGEAVRSTCVIEPVALIVPMANLGFSR